MNWADDPTEEDLTQRLTTFLSSCIIKPQPALTWDKIIGCEDAKRELYQKIVLPHKLLELPQYYDDCITTPGDVLLEGEPGSGRTRMAHTAAATCKADFFCVVNCVEVFSLFGIESSIFIRMLFTTAKKFKRSVIYLRNLDSFEYDCNWIVLPAKSELKYQMEFWQERYRFVEGKLESLSVIGATRSFKHIDPGILHRFGKRVTCPLPNSKQRLQMLLMFMADARTSFYDKDWKILVENSEGFTGRRIQTICQNVITSSRVLPLHAKDADRVETSCINLDSFSRWVPVSKKIAPVNVTLNINLPLTASSSSTPTQEDGESMKNEEKIDASSGKQGWTILQNSFVPCL